MGAVVVNPYTQQYVNAGQQQGLLAEQPVQLSTNVNSMLAAPTGSVIDPINKHIVGMNMAANEKAVAQKTENERQTQLQSGINWLNKAANGNTEMGNVLKEMGGAESLQGALRTGSVSLQDLMAQAYREVSLRKQERRAITLRNAREGKAGEKAAARGKALWAAFRKTNPELIDHSIEDAVKLNPQYAESYIQMSKDRGNQGRFANAGVLKDRVAFDRQWNAEGLDKFLTATMDRNFPSGLNPVDMNNYRESIKDAVYNIIQSTPEGERADFKGAIRTATANALGANGLGKQHPHYQITRADVLSNSPRAQEALNDYKNYLSAKGMYLDSNVDVDKEAARLLLQDIKTGQSSLGWIDRTAPTTVGINDAIGNSIVDSVGAAGYYTKKGLDTVGRYTQEGMDAVTDAARDWYNGK